MSNLSDALDLKELYPRIRTEVSKSLFKIRTMVPPELWRDEVDELTQIACFKYWQNSQRKQIIYQHAYISKIIHSLIVDTVRRYKATAGMSIDEYGEVLDGRVLVSSGEGMLDPAYEFEQMEVKKDCIAKIVREIISLPSQQRGAMICLLKDKVEDVQGFAEEFRKYGIAIDLISLPNEKRALRASRASLSVARKKMRTSKQRYVSAD